MNSKTCKGCHWKVLQAVDPKNIGAPRLEMCTGNGPSVVAFIAPGPKGPQMMQGVGYPNVSDASPACVNYREDVDVPPTT